MKLILSAFALAFAVPAAAQTAPATDHSQHGQMDHSKMDHGQMDHGKMSPAEHAAHMAGEAKKHDCPMAEDGKKMACCDHQSHKAEAKPAAHGDHGGH